MSNVPQPAKERIVPFAGHPLVVGLRMDESELIVHTALSWAEALDVEVYFAHVDETRLTIAEHPDGTVTHTGIDPDARNDAWEQRQAELTSFLEAHCAETTVTWHLRYLAGRIDRSLTHLARAVDAAGFVIGAHSPTSRWRGLDFLNHSVAARLTHHQHRPVLVVPTAVVDWKDATPWQ